MPQTPPKFIRLMATLVLAALPLAGQPSIELMTLSDSRLTTEARRLSPTQKLRVNGVGLFDGPGATLVLERFEVFAPGARIHVDTGAGVEIRQPPNTVHLRGSVEGVNDSLAVLMVDEAGLIQGLVMSEGRVFAIGTEDRSAPTFLAKRRTSVRQVEDSWLASSKRDFECESAALDTTPSTPLDSLLGPLDRPQLAVPLSSSTRGALPTYAVDVAVETDYEYRTQFASAAAATDYVSSLFAAISAIYTRDVDTQVRVSDLYLYESNTDPWTTSSALAALYQVGDWWNANRGDVERTVTHFLSGKSMGGGVAWVSALCSSTYGYGVTGGITGSYDPSNPTAVWDLTAVAHELGHNFGSGHTHRYTPPIDICYDECKTWDDPDDPQVCLEYYHGQTPWEVPPDGGSIMSYCHLHSPGMSNINLYLGRTGYYGTNSERVNGAILGHVQTRTCLPEPASATDIFEDGFESGNTTAWD